MALRKGRCRLPDLLNMNQAEFASKMGVQESTVSRWIRNEREMSFNKAVEASRLLNCHAEDLYDWIKVD